MTNAEVVFAFEKVYSTTGGCTGCCFDVNDKCKRPQGVPNTCWENPPHIFKFISAKEE